LVEDVAFPDRSWQARSTIGGGITAFVSVLAWYWIFGWLLISSRSQPNYPLPANAWFCIYVFSAWRSCSDANVVSSKTAAIVATTSVAAARVKNSFHKIAGEATVMRAAKHPCSPASILKVDTTRAVKLQI